MNKVLLLVLALFLGVMAFSLFTSKTPATPRLSYSQEIVDAFADWAKRYHKNFQNEDFETQAYRLEVFADNFEKIQKHNQLNKNYHMSENQFMDLTQYEFTSRHFGLNVQSSYRTPNEITPVSANAQSINWKDKGVVSRVKDQGACGSCWAFSATGNMESVHTIATGESAEYSEQQLVDCSGQYGNMGCNGGLMDFAFQYVLDNGIESEKQYPYHGIDESCHADASKYTHPVKAYTDVPSGNCDSLANALQKSPVSIAVDAEAWQFYGGGVFDDCGENLDHGVLLVGLQAGEYWLVKNSWSSGWGEQGYIRLATGNTCGLCNDASSTSA